MWKRPMVLIGAVVVAMGLVAVGCGDDSSDSGASSTTRAPSSTSSTSSATTAGKTDQPDSAVWPFACDTTRFTDPVDAARSFATTYLGFTDPVVGTFLQGDSRSGEVEVRADAKGPVTTVLVRQLTPDDSWWVLGAATPNLVLESPATLAKVSSPVTLSGRSTAFEGTVNVQVNQDGTLTPLKEDFVTGGANGEMGPFSKTVDFPAPTATAGAIVLRTLSAENGHVWEASVVRVAFGS
jgi:hypothetical protein